MNLRKFEIDTFWNLSFTLRLSMKDFAKYFSDFLNFLKNSYKIGFIVLFVIFLLFITFLVVYGLKVVTITTGFFLLLSLAWVLLAGTNIISDIKQGKFLRGIEDLFIVVLTLAILIVLYVIASNRSLKLDLTAEKLFSLSPYSIEVINKISNDVRIILFAKKDVATELEKILEEYQKNSGEITFITVDPIKDPITAKKYELPQGEEIIIVVESGENKKYIRGSSLVKYERTEYGSRPVGIKVEEEVTSAILNVTSSSRVIYFLVGNGEYRVLQNAPGSEEEYTFKTLRSYLEKANFTLRELNLSTTKDIPSDAGGIVIIAPRRITPIEIQEKLYEFYKNGGGIAIFLESVLGNVTYDRTFSINYLLTKFGLYVKNNVVFDEERFNPYMGKLFYIIPYIHFSPITSDIKSKGLPVQLVTAMAISRMESVNEELGTRVYDLMSTSENSWGETSIDVSGKFLASKDKNDITPPIILGYAVESLITNNNKSGKLVVIGDIDFLSDYFIESMPGNLELALNSIEWISKENVSLSIKPKSIKSSPIILSQADANLVLVISLVVVPLLMLLPGIIVWIVRSKKVK